MWGTQPIFSPLFYDIFFRQITKAILQAQSTQRLLRHKVLPWWKNIDKKYEENMIKYINLYLGVEVGYSGNVLYYLLLSMSKAKIIQTLTESLQYSLYERRSKLHAPRIRSTGRSVRKTVTFGILNSINLRNGISNGSTFVTQWLQFVAWMP